MNTIENKKEEIIKYLDCEYEYGFKSIYGVNTDNEPILIIE